MSGSRVASPLAVAVVAAAVVVSPLAVAAAAAVVASPLAVAAVVVATFRNLLIGFVTPSILYRLIYR